MSDRSSKLFKRALGKGRRAASKAAGAVRGRMQQTASPYKAGDLVTLSFAEAAEGQVEWGTTVLAGARAMNVDLDHFCGGNSSCGTCRVEVKEGSEHLSSMHINEEIVLGVDGARNGNRLACQARVQGPVTVRVPDFFMVR